MRPGKDREEKKMQREEEEWERKREKREREKQKNDVFFILGKFSTKVIHPVDKPLFSLPVSALRHSMNNKCDRLHLNGLKVFERKKEIKKLPFHHDIDPCHFSGGKIGQSIKRIARVTLKISERNSCCLLSRLKKIVKISPITKRRKKVQATINFPSQVKRSLVGQSCNMYLTDVARLKVTARERDCSIEIFCHEVIYIVTFFAKRLIAWLVVLND